MHRSVVETLRRHLAWLGEGPTCPFAPGLNPYAEGPQDGTGVLGQRVASQQGQTGLDEPGAQAGQQPDRLFLRSETWSPISTAMTSLWTGSKAIQIQLSPYSVWSFSHSLNIRSFLRTVGAALAAALEGPQLVQLYLAQLQLLHHLL